MATRIGINGYGRIGRNVLRALYESGRAGEIKIVAINDLGSASTNAHLTRFDTVHGRFAADVRVEGETMIVNGDRIRVLAERDPSKLPWRDLEVDIVLECTGLFTKQGQGVRSPRRRRAQGADLGPRRFGCRCHDRVRSESHDSQFEPDGDLQRLVYHQLSRAAGEGAE